MTTPPASPAVRPQRLDAIRIASYKALGALEVELPRPINPNSLDVVVLGSRNGVGKTSFLEGCALGVLGAEHPWIFDRDRSARPDPYRWLIRSGADRAKIETVRTTISGDRQACALDIQPEGIVTGGEAGPRRSGFPAGKEPAASLHNLFGFTVDPLILPPVLLFHSYRKTREGSLEMGALVGADRNFGNGGAGEAPRGGGISAFKMTMMQALMSRSGLFEGVEAGYNSHVVLDQLNGLLRTYAQGTVDRLRPLPDGSLELRVVPEGGGPSFSLDGLSSGQKEIISTLFLLWNATRDRPSLVLIDEPELHLNAAWQRTFLDSLYRLAPQNQYILATHSEELFAAVPARQRLMLHAD